MYFDAATTLDAVTGGPIRCEAYKPVARSGLLTWHPGREITTMVGSYRVSDGNLGCGWPVDLKPELRREREALRTRLGTAEGRMRDVEAKLLERRVTKSRPATAAASPKSVVDYEEDTPRPAYPRRRPGTAPIKTLPSGFGTQRQSTKASHHGTKFGRADERTLPDRYWPLTKNRGGGQAAGFSEPVRPMGTKHPTRATAPVSKIKAPVRRDRMTHFHWYDDMPARNMGQTKVRRPKEYEPRLRAPVIATTHQRTGFIRPPPKRAGAGVTVLSPPYAMRRK